MSKLTDFSLVPLSERRNAGSRQPQSPGAAGNSPGQSQGLGRAVTGDSYGSGSPSRGLPLHRMGGGGPFPPVPRPGGASSSTYVLAGGAAGGPRRSPLVASTGSLFPEASRGPGGGGGGDGGGGWQDGGGGGGEPNSGGSPGVAWFPGTTVLPRLDANGTFGSGAGGERTPQRLPSPQHFKPSGAVAGGGGAGGSPAQTSRRGSRSRSPPHAPRSPRDTPLSALAAAGAAAAAAAGGGGGGPQHQGQTITWAHVREAQQHALVESAGLLKPQANYTIQMPLPASAYGGGGGGGGGGQPFYPQQQQQPQAIAAQGSYTDYEGLSGGGPSSLSLTYPGSRTARGSGGALAAVAAAPAVAPLDLSEMDRDLRGREASLLGGGGGGGGLNRSSWSVSAGTNPAGGGGGGGGGGAAAMDGGGGGGHRMGSPGRGFRDGGGHQVVAGSVASGLLAYEGLVGPQFGSLGLVEGPLSGYGAGGGGGGGGSFLALSAVSGYTPAQLSQLQAAQSAVHTLQRRTLLLRLPHCWGGLGLELPAMVVQSGGGACLLVLPSDKPPARSEALAVEALLLDMLRDPGAAAARSAAWRADMLAALCADAITSLNQAAKTRQSGKAGGGGGAAATGAGAGGGGGGGVEWQLRGLSGIQLMTPPILAPFTTLLQGSLQEKSQSVDVQQRPGLFTAHTRRGVPPHTGSGLGGGGGAYSPYSTAAAAMAAAHGYGSVNSSGMGMMTAAATYGDGAGDLNAAGSAAAMAHRMRASAPGVGGGGGALQVQLSSSSLSGLAGGRAVSGRAGAGGKAASGEEGSSGAGAGGAGGGGGGGEAAGAEPAAAAGGGGGGGGGGGLNMSAQASAALTVGTCICMADIVRQVEVGCGERGRALAGVWNAFVAAHQESVDALHRRAAAQQAEIHELSKRLGDRHDFAREMEMLEFLKRENARFKSREAELLAKGILSMQAAPGARDGSRMVVKAGGALGEALDGELSGRIAQLRWRHALQVLGTRTHKVAFKSGAEFQPPLVPTPRIAAGGPEAEAMVSKLNLFHKLTLAVERATARRRAFGRGRNADAAARMYAAGDGDGDGGGGPAAPTSADLAAAALSAGAGLSAKLLEGLDAEDTAKLLANLNVEAQVLLLAMLPELRRAEVLAAMSDQDRAQVVVVMSSVMRAHTAHILGRGMWAVTMRAVKDSPPLGARMLTGMDTAQAVDELLSWAAAEQLDVLAAMDAPHAARILAAAPLDVRQRLLAALPPHIAANIVSAMLPPPAAASLNSLEPNAAVAILLAMDPSSAAALLQELGAVKAAEALLGMESLEARQNILECMQPRVAAETVLEMDTQAGTSGSAPGGSSGGSGAGAEGVAPPGAGLDAAGVMYPGTEALGEMASPSADRIMGFMNVQDKAAVLSRMDPDKAAELLALLSPSESVALLACLSDTSTALVVEALRQEDRNALMKVLTNASGGKGHGHGRNGKGQGKSGGGGGKGGGKGGRQAANSKSQGHNPPSITPTSLRPPRSPAASAASAAAHLAADFPSPPGRGIKPAMAQSMSRAMDVYAGEGSASEGSEGDGEEGYGGGGGGGRMHGSVAGGDGADAVAAAEAVARLRRRSSVSPVPLLAELSLSLSRRAAEAGAGAQPPAAHSHAGPVGKPPRAPGSITAAAGLTSVAAAAAAALSNSRRNSAASGGAGGASDGGEQVELSDGGASGSEDEEEDDDDDEDDIPAASQRAGGGGAKGSVRIAGGGAAAVRRHRSSDLEAQLAAGRNRSARQSLTGRGAQSMAAARDARGDGAGAGGRTASNAGTRTAPLSRSTTFAVHGDGDGGGEGGGGGGGGGGRDPSSLRMLKSALRNNQHQGQRGGGGGGGSKGTSSDIGHLLRAASHTHAAGAAGGGGGGGGLAAPASTGHMLSQLDSGGGAAPAAAAAAAQSSVLGRAPKNVRLATAMMQHRNARPRPKGWLMGLVESIYKEGEALLRKMGRMEALRRQSVPEIVFAHFSNKYGQRSLVDEYAACLANTLALHRSEDLRLDTFARFLSEEWDFATFIEFINANSLALQPGKVLCIEYPREAGRDEAYPWLCSTKATAIADGVLGPRAGPVRDAFNAALMSVSVPADDADVDKLRRDPRYAAAAQDAAAGAGPPPPERFHRLPRPRFLALLAAEIARVNAAIGRIARGRFEVLDGQGSGCVPAAAAGGYLAGVIAPNAPRSGNLVVQEATVAFVSNALAYQLEPGAAPEAVALAANAAAAAASDAPIGLDAWVAASVQCTALRDHVKLHTLRPMRLGEDGDDDDGGLLGGFLLGLTRRHTRLMAARLRDWARTAARGTASGGGGGGAAGDATNRSQKGGGGNSSSGGADAALVLDLSAAVDKAASGGEKFRAYAQMLVAIIKQQVTAVMAMLTGADGAGAAGDSAAGELEDALCRLEDCAIIMLRQARYLLECPDLDVTYDRVKRLPLQARLAAVGRAILVWRQHEDTVQNLAAMVVQSVWRNWRSQRAKRLAAEAAEAGAALVEELAEEPSGSLSGGGGGTSSGGGLSSRVVSRVVTVTASSLIGRQGSTGLGPAAAGASGGGGQG